MNLRFGQVVLFSPTLHWDFMGKRKIWIGISAIFVILSLTVVGVKGLNYSIDFTGGVEVAITLEQDKASREEIEALAKKVTTGDIEVTTISVVSFPNGSGFVVRVPRVKGTDEDAINMQANEISKIIRSTFKNPVSISSTSISGKVGAEEQLKGYISILLSLLAIMVYVFVRFDARFAPGAVICLFHDVIIALGVMTFFDRPFSNTSVAAFLTIVGFSINDTIVVYDRIRETMAANPRLPVEEVTNTSINQTMSRTVLTSLTTFLALLVLVLMGGGAIHDFALTMLIGIIVGSYSSIYVAAPFTIMFDNFLKSRGIDINEKFSRKKKAVDPHYIPPVVVRKRS